MVGTGQIPGFKHSIYQWDAILDDGTMFKGGWAGQGLIVNPKWDVVAVYNGYFSDDKFSEEALFPAYTRRSEEHLWWSKRRRGKAVAHSVSLHLSLAVL